MLENLPVEEIWSAKDEDGCSVTLEWREDLKEWQLSHLTGPFSGYPTTSLTRAQLKELSDKLIDELTREVED